MAMVRELLRHLLKRPATLKYPFEKTPLPKGLRGRLTLDLRLCIGCGLCYQDCPSGAIEMIGTGTEAEFKYHLDRCLFCGKCEEDCPRKAIMMTEEYELACYDRAGMVIEFKRENEPSK